MSASQTFRVAPSPCTLRGHGLRLEPLGHQHLDGLKAAARDGELWTLRVTSVPEPDKTVAYIDTALAEGNRMAFAVIDEATETVIGCTSYHDIVPAVARLEIGYTWYAKSRQRTYVNTACKLMLMTHAFDTLGAAVVGWRTDNFNYASLRRDGTVRDTVMYSVIAGEWPEVRDHLTYQLKRHAG
jgi:RimJ/RimL family protein N-acetyltransferase